LNDRGNVAFKVLAGSEGVWYGGNGAGGIVYTGRAA
jgi:hypothetical protein